MEMDSKSILIMLLVFAVLIVIFGIIYPLINMHQCTETVEGTVVEDNNTGNGNVLLSKNRSVTATYTYNDKLYYKRNVKIPRDAIVTKLNLKINPKHPGVSIIDNKIAIYTTVIGSAFMAAIFIFIAVSGYINM